MPRFRVTTFQRPRAPWRDTWDGAMGDAIRLELASWDGERREHFLAIPVEIKVETTDQRGRVSSHFTQSEPPRDVR